MVDFEKMPDWVKEKRQRYLDDAKAAGFLDAVFFMHFYNSHQCHGQQPKIETNEVFKSPPDQESLSEAVAKCNQLISGGYWVGEALRTPEGAKNRGQKVIDEFKTNNPGFSQRSYEAAMNNGKTAAIF